MLFKINRADHEDIVSVRHFASSLKQLLHVVELQKCKYTPTDIKTSSGLLSSIVTKQSKNISNVQITKQNSNKQLIVYDMPVVIKRLIS